MRRKASFTLLGLGLAGALRRPLTAHATKLTTRSRPTGTGKRLMTMAAALALLMPAFAVRAGDSQPPRLLASGLMGTIGSTAGRLRFKDSPQALPLPR